MMQLDTLNEKIVNVGTGGETVSEGLPKVNYFNSINLICSKKKKFSLLHFRYKFRKRVAAGCSNQIHSCHLWDL